MTHYLMPLTVIPACF